MSNTEFSNEFDILFNNIMSNQAPGLDEYEKSIFLTEAQEDLVLSIYSGNSSGSFENSEEFRQYLAPLVNTIEATSVDNTDYIGITKDSKLYTVNNDFWFITSEYIITSEDVNKCNSSLKIPVIPVTQDEFSRVENNPFRGASKRRVLRLDIGINPINLSNDSNRIFELVTPYNISKYIIRYIRKPKPIILKGAISGSLTIEGEDTESQCELNPVLHRRILEKAVLLAKASFVSNPGQ